RRHTRFSRDWSSDVCSSDLFGLEDTRGAIVARILPGGPAARAGVRVGDVIRSLNGQPVEHAYDLVNRLAPLPADSTARLALLRQGRTLELDVRAGLRPPARLPRR